MEDCQSVMLCDERKKNKRVNRNRNVDGYEERIGEMKFLYESAKPSGSEFIYPIKNMLFQYKNYLRILESSL